MDRNAKKLCDLLQHPDNMRRCAGAISLATLAPKDAAVVRALGDALQSANHTLTPFLLEALEAIGSKAAVPHVLPLLQAEDLETRVRAIAILSKVGSNVVPDIRKQLEDAPRREKVALADLLARIHTREAFNVVLQLLVDPDFEVVKEACEAVHRHADGATPQQQSAHHKQVVEFMGTSRVKKHERILASCLLMLGYIGRPEARAILLKHTTPRMSPYVRRHGLIGLKGVAYTSATAATVAKQLTPYLGDEDYDIVRLTLDVFDQLPLSGAGLTQWAALLKNRHGRVRAYAARRIADSDSLAANKRLLALLGHEDTAVGEIAAGALANHEKATPVLLEALAKEKDIDAGWRLVKILKPHSERIKATDRNRFAKQAAKDLQADSPRHEAMLYFLRNVDPGAAAEVLRDAGLSFKRAKKWEKAIQCLRRLAQGPSFDDATRFELCVCNIKQSSKDLAPHLRDDDHALRGLHALRRNSGFKLLDRLKKERTLDAADLFYVGFHFVEGRADDKEFGEQVLTYVARKWPSTKAGKAAKSKLKLVAPPKSTKRPTRKKTAARKKAPTKKKTPARKKTPAKKSVNKPARKTVKKVAAGKKKSPKKRATRRR